MDHIGKVGKSIKNTLKSISDTGSQVVGFVSDNTIGLIYKKKSKEKEEDDLEMVLDNNAESLSNSQINKIVRENKENNK